METLPTVLSEDPDQVEEILNPILGNVRVSSLTRRYRAEIRGRGSPRVAIFTIRASDSLGILEPPHEYFGLNICLSGRFSVTEQNLKTGFGQDIFLARPDRSYSPELRSGCQMLGANVFVERLRVDIHKLTGSDASGIPDIGNRIDTSGAAGLMLARNMFRLWSESNRPEIGTGSEIAVAELEDELITGFVMTMLTLSDPRRIREGRGVQRSMARAEEYLASHLDRAVSRADLADAAGVSIRTLSRAFLKRHGTGPAGFLKARRLHASYRQLLTAEAGSTRVTDVAMRHGFNHLGRFAMEYKKAFGESPSATLNRSSRGQTCETN